MTQATFRLRRAEFDRPPGKFFGYSGAGYRSLKAKPLKWAAASEIWGTLTYTVLIDRKPVGTTTATRFSIHNRPVEELIDPLPQRRECVRAHWLHLAAHELSSKFDFR